jgi:anti-sigma B factor antagonist
MMNITAKTKKGICRLAIDGEMTIYTALETKAQLLQHLDKRKELEVDLSQVTDIDSAGLQLLILLKRETMARDTVLRLTAHSASVTEVIDTLNLAAYFGDPILLAA